MSANRQSWARAAVNKRRVLIFFIVASLGSTSVRQKVLAVQAERQTLLNTYEKYRCTQNPFLTSINDEVTAVERRMENWLKGSMSLEKDLVSDDKYKELDHSRLRVFRNLTTCDSECVGGKCSSDTSKIVCGLSSLRAPCVVYSLGGNNQWGFELGIVQRTPCEVHTFDCTGPRSRFKVPSNPMIHFHHICIVPESAGHLGNGNLVGKSQTLREVQAELGHERIDILKMDIEGYEWPIMLQWYTIFDRRSSPEFMLPMQILVEVHYRTQMTDLASHKGPFKFPTDMITLQRHLIEMGYFTAVYDENIHCMHCVELSLLRMWCPQ